MTKTTEVRRAINLPINFMDYVDEEQTSSDSQLNHNWVDGVTKDGPISRYWYIIAEGLNATSNLSGTKTVCRNTEGISVFRQRYIGPSPTFTPRKLGYVATGNLLRYIPSSFSPDLTITTASNRAVIGYLRRAEAVTTKLQGIVVAGELAKTLKMIRSPAQAIRRGVDRYLDHIIRNGPRVKKHRRPKFVADSWLEYSFGWTPLIHDIDSGMHALATERNLQRRFEPVSYIGFEEIASDTPINGTSWGPISITADVRRKEDITVRYYGSVRTYCEYPLYWSAANYGFTPSQFIPSIYNLIPYSFLVDYFTNLGDVLEAWSFRTNSLAWTARTVRSKVSFETVNPAWTNSSVPFNGFEKIGYAMPGSVYWERTTVSRLADVDPKSSIRLEFRIPGVGSKKWLNLAALGLKSTRARNALR